MQSFDVVNRPIQKNVMASLLSIFNSDSISPIGISLPNLSLFPAYEPQTVDSPTIFTHKSFQLSESEKFFDWWAKIVTAWTNLGADEGNVI